MSYKNKFGHTHKDTPGMLAQKKELEDKQEDFQLQSKERGLMGNLDLELASLLHWKKK